MIFNRTRDSWDFLLTYQSFELVKAEYKKRHGRQVNTRHSREIVASFAHERTYFSAAAGSDLAAKPLLPFYGVASLSRVLTLLLNRSLREMPSKLLMGYR
ncbi:YaaC family protein [Agrobacterium vitis]|uniref:YaaC family protein n=1 Tax=Agrobacterium vitis TaxID=373 RepID=UPI003B52C06C